MKRVYRYLRALLFGRLDKGENLDYARTDTAREKEEDPAQMRERAVQAITRKNNVRVLVDQEENLMEDLEAEIRRAQQQGNHELARRLECKRSIKQEALTELRGALKNQEETVKEIKDTIRRQIKR